MFSRFIAWWIRNAIYIGPLATCVSALAALLSVYMVTRTFRQARKDRTEELLAKRPKFKLVDGSVPASSLRKLDRSITPHYRPQFSLLNINPNPATRVTFACRIYPDEGSDVCKFVRKPSDDVDQNETVSIKTEFLELAALDVPYFLTIVADYADSRTNEKYSQVIYRKFYIDEGQNAELEKLDMAEVEDLISQRKLVDN
jgi:hypothetical protein